jgi:SAM-dependent methyltransferase
VWCKALRKGDGASPRTHTTYEPQTRRAQSGELTYTRTTVTWETDRCDGPVREEGRETDISHTSDGRDIVDRYEASYARFGSDVYTEIRREVYGEDLGQNSWLTIDELERFVSLLNLDAASRLLDIGCGSGGPALHVCRTTGCEVVGIDIHEQAIATADRIADESGLRARARFERADAGTVLPFDDGSFDAILSIDTICHLRDRPAVFADWARLLKPGGRMVFTDPTTVTGPIESDEFAIRSSSDFYLYVPKGTDERALAAAGLVVLRVEDATENMAEIARRRHDARERHAAAIIRTEGDDPFAREQRFLELASRLARERRLSRLAYAAERPRG